MPPTSAIGVISKVLALSGVTSIRMFLPIFLYLLSMRLSLAFPDYAPEIVRQMAEQTPAWQISYVFLTIFGILAALELAAVREPSIKEFLVEDFDKYAKPVMSCLMTFGLLSSSQSEEIQELLEGTPHVQEAAFGGFAAVMTIVSGAANSFCCRVRAAVLEQLHAMDPENSLGLQTISNWLGEIVLVSLVLLLVVLPILALILTICGVLLGMAFKCLWALYEKRHSHPCTACAEAGRETIVSDCAMICPACGAEQPDVRRVALFGFSGTLPLAGLPPERHAFRLLAAHRCRWCASPLTRAHACKRCGRKQWTDELRTFYVKQTDIRGGVLVLLALLGFALPFIALMLFLIFFRPLVLSPLAVHLSMGARFVSKLLMMFLKLLFLIPMLFLSMVPGVGLLVLLPFIVRYLYVRKKFLAAVR